MVLSNTREYGPPEYELKSANEKPIVYIAYVMNDSDDWSLLNVKYPTSGKYSGYLLRRIINYFERNNIHTIHFEKTKDLTKVSSKIINYLIISDGLFLIMPRIYPIDIFYIDERLKSDYNFITKHNWLTNIFAVSESSAFIGICRFMGIEPITTGIREKNVRFDYLGLQSNLDEYIPEIDRTELPLNPKKSRELNKRLDSFITRLRQIPKSKRKYYRLLDEKSKFGIRDKILYKSVIITENGEMDQVHKYQITIDDPEFIKEQGLIHHLSFDPYRLKNKLPELSLMINNPRESCSAKIPSLSCKIDTINGELYCGNYQLKELERNQYYIRFSIFLDQYLSYGDRVSYSINFTRPGVHAGFEEEIPNKLKSNIIYVSPTIKYKELIIELKFRKYPSKIKIKHLSIFREPPTIYRNYIRKDNNLEQGEELEWHSAPSEQENETLFDYASPTFDVFMWKCNNVTERIQVIWFPISREYFNKNKV